jgi:hypothetical protein
MKPVPTSRNKVMITKATKAEPFRNQSKFLVSPAYSPHRIFSHGSSIVKTNVHSNHILHLHTNAPNADVGGRFGSDRDVMTETVDGAAHDFPSLEEPGFRWVDLTIWKVERG